MAIKTRLSRTERSNVLCGLLHDGLLQLAAITSFKDGQPSAKTEYLSKPVSGIS
jgi:hypothetical protein